MNKIHNSFYSEDENIHTCTCRYSDPQLLVALDNSHNQIWDDTVYTALSDRVLLGYTSCIHIFLRCHCISIVHRHCNDILCIHMHYCSHLHLVKQPAIISDTQRRSNINRATTNKIAAGIRSQKK